MHVLYWPECSISRPGHRAHPGGEAWAPLADPVLRSLALRPTGGPPATGVSGDPPGFHIGTPQARALGPSVTPLPHCPGSGSLAPPFLIPAVRPALGLGPWEGHPAESWAVSCGVGAPSPLLRQQSILRPQDTQTPGCREEGVSPGSPVSSASASSVPSPPPRFCLPRSGNAGET